MTPFFQYMYEQLTTLRRLCALFNANDTTQPPKTQHVSRASQMPTEVGIEHVVCLLRPADLFRRRVLVEHHDVGHHTVVECLHASRVEGFGSRQRHQTLACVEDGGFKVEVYGLRSSVEDGGRFHGCAKQEPLLLQGTGVTLLSYGTCLLYTEHMKPSVSQVYGPAIPPSACRPAACRVCACVDGTSRTSRVRRKGQEGEAKGSDGRRMQSAQRTFAFNYTAMKHCGRCQTECSDCLL